MRGLGGSAEIRNSTKRSWKKGRGGRTACRQNSSVFTYRAIKQLASYRFRNGHGTANNKKKTYRKQRPQCLSIYLPGQTPLSPSSNLISYPSITASPTSTTTLHAFLPPPRPDKHAIHTSPYTAVTTYISLLWVSGGMNGGMEGFERVGESLRVYVVSGLRDGVSVGARDWLLV